MPEDKTPETSSEQSELPGLKELFQDAVAACMDIRRYAVFVAKPWSEVGLHVAFITGLVAVVFTLFMTIDQFRYVGWLMGTTEVIPTITFTENSFYIDGNLPYVAEYRGEESLFGDQPIYLAISKDVPPAFDRNAPHVWLNDTKVQRNFYIPGLPPQASISITDLNLVVTDRVIIDKLHDARMAFIPNTFVMMFLVQGVANLLMIALGAALLWGLLFFQQRAPQMLILLKLMAYAITPAVFLALLAQTLRLGGSPMFQNILLLGLFLYAVGQGYFAFRETEKADDPLVIEVEAEEPPSS